jgi:hypothetical protein
MAEERNIMFLDIMNITEGKRRGWTNFVPPSNYATLHRDDCSNK